MLKFLYFYPFSKMDSPNVPHNNLCISILGTFKFNIEHILNLHLPFTKIIYYSNIYLYNLYILMFYICIFI